MPGWECGGSCLVRETLQEPLCPPPPPPAPEWTTAATWAPEDFAVSLIQLCFMELDLKGGRRQCVGLLSSQSCVVLLYQL